VSGLLGVMQVLALILGAEGYALVRKKSGEEALQHIETCEVLPDICLLDMSMPGMDGLEVRGAQKSCVPCCQCPTT
jgi:CheY-like chemotaxis protein